MKEESSNCLGLNANHLKIYTVLITGTTQFGDIMVILHYTIKIAVCVNASIVTPPPSCNVSIYSAPADDNGCT